MARNGISLRDMEVLVRSMAASLGLKLVGEVTLDPKDDRFHARFSTVTPAVTTYLPRAEFNGLLDAHGHNVPAVDLDPKVLDVLRQYVNTSAARVRGASIRQWLLDERGVRFDTAATDEEASADFEAFERMATVLMDHMAVSEKRLKGYR